MASRAAHTVHPLSPALHLPPRPLLFCPGHTLGARLPRPAGVGQPSGPAFQGARKVSNEEARSSPRPSVWWCAQPAQPQLLQLQREALLQHPAAPAAASCPPGWRKRAAPAAPHTGGRPVYEHPAAVTGSPLHEPPCRHVALPQPLRLSQHLRLLPEREAHLPQLMVGGLPAGPGPGTIHSPRRALPR